MRNCFLSVSFRLYHLAFPGFGGRHGVETDRQDRSAHGYDEPEHEKPARKEPPVASSKGTASSLKARFEKLAASEVSC